MQFIIYIPHDGRSVSHKAKIKKKQKQLFSQRLISSASCATPSFIILLHLSLAQTNVLSLFVQLSLIFVSLPLVVSSLARNRRPFLLARYLLRVSSLYLSFSHLPPSHQQLSFAQHASTFQPIISRAVQTACVPSLAQRRPTYTMVHNVREEPSYSDNADLAGFRGNPGD